MGARTNVQENKISYELTEITPDNFREKGITAIGEKVDDLEDRVTVLEGQG